MRPTLRGALKETSTVWHVIGALRLRRSAGDCLTLFGFYGADESAPNRNVGDNAILESMLHSLGSLRHPMLIRTLTPNPAYARRGEIFDGPFSGPYLGRWIPIVRRTRVLVLGGGGLFQDYGRAGRTPYLLFRLSLLFWMAGRPIFWYSMGVGPLTTSAGRAFTRAAARLASGITVRDRESAGALIDIGVPAAKISVTADPVSALVAPARASGRAVDSPDHLGMSLFPFDRLVYGDADRSDQLLRLFRDFVERVTGAGRQVTLVAFQNEPDGEYSASVAAGIPGCRVLGPGLSTSDIIDEFASFSHFIGMRFHSIIFAFLRGIAAGAISYHPKVSSLVRSARLEDWALSLEELDLTSLLDLEHSLRDDRERVVRRGDEWLESSRTAFARNDNLLRTLLAR